MNKNQVVWRTLADAAFETGKRQWYSLEELADAARSPVSTTHQALGRLTEVGAIEKSRRGGFRVVSPQKIVTLLAANRRLASDTVAKTTLEGASQLLDSGSAILGGTDAAAAILGGRAPAGKGVRIVYAEGGADLSDLPEGNEVLVLRQGAVVESSNRSGSTSLAQTYADLFALPGWQAAEFLEALSQRIFGAVDWEQKEPAGA